MKTDPRKVETSPVDAQAIAQKLKGVGVNDETIHEFIGAYPQERILRQLMYLPYRQAREPAGLLVRAIKGDWSAPQAYLNREAKSAQKPRQPNQQNPATEQLRTIEKQIVQDARLTHQLREIEKRLSPSEIRALRVEANRRFRRRVRRVWPKEQPIPRVFLTAEYRCLLKERYVQPTGQPKTPNQRPAL